MSEEVKEVEEVQETVEQEVTEEKLPFQMTDEELVKARNGEEQGTEETKEEVKPEETTEKKEKKKKEEKPEERVEPTEKTETTTISVEEFEKLKRKAEKNDKLLAKLGTELGMYRKVSPEAEVEELQKIRDAYVKDPLEGMQLYDAYKERKIAEYRETQKTQIEELENNTKDIIESVAPNFTDQMKDITELLKEDGYSKDIITSFESNPFLYGADTLFQIHKRVELLKSHRELKEENEKLKKENEELRKKPGKLLSEIEKETARSKVVSKHTGKVSPETDLDKPVFLMNKEELAKAQTGG